MATVKKTMMKKKVAPKKIATKKAPMMQAPPTGSAPMGGGPMMKKGGMVKKAQPGIKQPRDTSYTSGDTSFVKKYNNTGSTTSYTVKPKVTKDKKGKTITTEASGQSSTNGYYKNGGSMGPKQQAAVAIAMKKAGKSPKKKMGGSLKAVPSDKVGLSKLPTPVRNKMGYAQKGTTVAKAQCGMMKPKSGKMSMKKGGKMSKRGC